MTTFMLSESSCSSSRQCFGDVPGQRHLWLWKLHEDEAAIVVVECGGGLAIPSVRVQGEDAVDGGGKGSRLIRINPVHCKVPPTNGIGIPMGSMQGPAVFTGFATASARHHAGARVQGSSFSTQPS